MMVTAIFQVFNTVLSFVLGQLPTFTPPDTTSAVAAITDTRIWQFLSWANWFTPIDVALTLIAARVTIAVALWSFEFLSWAGTKLHIFGGD